MKPQKQNQTYLFTFWLIVAIIIGVCLSSFSSMSAIFWGFGILIGFTLQRSKFCFSAAFRDIILFRIGAMAKGLLVALLISTIGFFVVRLWSTGQGLSVPGNYDPLGWHTVVGATFFGIGMVIAGGCASGTLMRMGEGYMLQWLVLIGLILGSIFGSYQYSWWCEGEVLSLDKIMGIWPGFLLQLVFIALLYYVVHWWENRV